MSFEMSSKKPQKDFKDNKIEVELLYAILNKGF